MQPDDDHDDHAVWTGMAAGDAACLGLLFDRHYRAVYNHCFRLTASWSEAEDVVSDVFVQVWRSRGRLTLRGDSAAPLLLGVATNLCRNRTRSLRRWQQFLMRMRRVDAEPDHADDVAGRVDDERRMAAVLAEIRRLPRAEREALALCVWSGLSYAEAAAALGIAESSVRSRVSRARSRLARADAPADPTEPSTNVEGARP